PSGRVTGVSALWSVEATWCCSGAAGRSSRMAIERLVTPAPRKQPWAARPLDVPIGPQDPEERRRQHYITLLAALAVDHMNDSAGAVDVVNAQPHDLGGTQARGICSRERYTTPPHRDRLQKGGDLLRAQDHRNCLATAGVRNALRKILAAQRDAIEK